MCQNVICLIEGIACNVEKNRDARRCIKECKGMGKTML